MADDPNGNTTGNGGGSASIPPYIPFQTFLTFLKQLKTDGLPPQIDKSVLSKFSGGTQGQLKVALKSMGLMDDNKPTDDLAALVEAYDTSEFNGLILQLLHRTYPYVFKLDLMNATPLMFADAFKVTGAREDVSRKCRTFFLHAAKQAGVPLGNRLLTGSVPRSTSSAPRKKTKPKNAGGGDSGGEVANAPNPQSGQPISNAAMEYKLVDLMKESDVGDAERNAIWTLIQYLTRKGKG